MRLFESGTSGRIGFSRWVGALFLFGLALRLWGLGGQPLTADDRLAAVSAANFVDGGQLGPMMWNHPVLRNLLIFWSLDTWGANAWALKLPSLVLGAATVPLVAVVAARLLASPAAGLIAGLLLALDPVHIGFSRQAAHEVYMACFALAGIAGALRFLDRGRPGWLLLSGLAFGLGLASKWDVLFPLAGTAGYLLYREVRAANGPIRERAGRLSFVAIALTALPLAIYVLTFVPWLARGYDLGEWVGLQRAMAMEVAEHPGTHNPYLAELDHRPLLWFVKPVAYASFTLSAGRPVVLLEISNPLVWLLILPAVAFVAYRGARAENPDRVYLAFLFVATYLPFALANRPIWVHSAISILPYGFAAVAGALTEGWLQRRERVIYLLLVAAVSVPLYLLATGAGYESAVLRPLVELYRPSFDR